MTREQSAALEWAISELNEIGVLGNEVRHMDELCRLRAALSAPKAEAVEPEAWQYRVKIDGAWSRWMLSEHYRSPCKAEEQRPLYLNPVPALTDEAVRGEDWENAAHSLLWAEGHIELFYQIAEEAKKEAKERRAAFPSKGGAHG